MSKKNSIAFDTNIIVYALDNASKYHFETATEILRLYKEKMLLICTQQNLLEAESVLVRGYKQDRVEVIKAIDHFISSLKVRVLNPLPTTLKRYRSIQHIAGSRDIFDGYLAATLLDHNVSCLYTYNEKDFAGITDFTATRKP